MEGWFSLGNLYKMQGSISEAEYFYKKGWKLAEKLKSSIYASDFLFNLAEIEYKRGRLESSFKVINDAEDCIRDVRFEPIFNTFPQII
jgi:tetratricopeptide (TPR) repeat protein